MKVGACPTVTEARPALHLRNDHVAFVTITRHILSVLRVLHQSPTHDKESERNLSLSNNDILLTHNAHLTFFITRSNPTKPGTKTKLPPLSFHSTMMLNIILSAFITTLAVFTGAFANLGDPPIPSQAVIVKPSTFAVMGPNANFRNDSFNMLFNPTSTTPPFFQVFDDRFLTILGASASIREITSYANRWLQAPIYNPPTDEVFFSSNDGGPLGMSDLEHNNVISKINMARVEAALSAKAAGPVNVPVTPLNLSDSVQANDEWRHRPIQVLSTPCYIRSRSIATLPRSREYSASLQCYRFAGSLPSLILVTTVPLRNQMQDNYYGRQFVSLNDIKIHPTNGKFFFTDVEDEGKRHVHLTTNFSYGFLNHFRPVPLIPFQVYRFDPLTSAVRVVADGFNKPNGIAFTPDGATVYIADTGASGGFLGNNGSAPATLYAFDVDPITNAFMNRRVLAYIDAGVPDGIQLDTEGNIYTGCADGTQVFAPDGTLLGKFFLGMSSAEMIFAGDGRLVILGETKMYLAKIAAKSVSLSGPSL
ncbi:hypothetical protein D9757_003954 [Collybiopsis confluens]|uniref:SMP-30/Gluconolactonase/LRE-like region domain-containing protein n=1 Tax=Collybiopsis confluens TaxID=2823264 RepID=A0A8H5HX22_9AGAR|nr:hypothetical protein D9757_003954 [Collybiopsis confluens]